MEGGFARIAVPFDRARLPLEAWEFRAYIVLNPGRRQTTVLCDWIEDVEQDEQKVLLTLEFVDKGEIANCSLLRTEGDGLTVHTFEDTVEVHLRIEAHGF